MLKDRLLSDVVVLCSVSKIYNLMELHKTLAMHFNNNENLNDTAGLQRDDWFIIHPVEANCTGCIIKPILCC